LTSMAIESTDAIYDQVRAVLDEALSLGGRARELSPDSPLLGAIPELDSQAVLGVLMGLEERLAITIDDDEIDADVFETLQSLTALVARKVAGR